MADKILDTLTIDGVSMDMHSAQRFRSSKEITLSNRGTWYTGSTLTLTEPGVYLFLGAVNFPVTATTGQTYHLIRISTNSGGGEPRTAGEFSPANNALSMQICEMLKVESVPVTVSVDAMCYSAINTASETSLDAYKLIDLRMGNP